MAEITYLYDADGQAIAIEVDGERRELTDEERDRVPGKSVGAIRDVQTSIRSTLEEMKDSYSGGAIIVDIEATHGGYNNKNNYHYLVDGMKQHVETWTEPFGKPYLVEHDMKTTPKGRVEDAKFIPTGKSTGYHALDVKIGDADEIEQILDGRSLTVSVGSNPIDTVACSFCEHDLFHDGRRPNRVELKEAPSTDWLEQDAPGVYGLFGMTMGDLWNYEETDAGRHLVSCRHVRGLEAPPVGSEDAHRDGEDIAWYLHGQRYNEVSRVNLPADQNDATGEFAHIRSVLEQTDGLDEETRLGLMIEELSRVERGAIDRARYSVVSEDSLFRPHSKAEAVRYAKQTDLNCFFDTGLWIMHSADNTADIESQIADYWQSGGRFIGGMEPAMGVKDALKLDSARAFGKWLRAQDDLSREEKRALDRLYLRQLRG